MAYPFFMLFTLLTASGQHPSLPPLLALEFEKVRINESPEDELSIYYGNLADILEILFTENEFDYERLRENRSDRIDKVEDSSLPKSWKNFLEAEIKLQWAFLEFRFGHDWDAFWGLRSAYKISKKLYENDPSFAPNLRTQGLLNIIFGTVPSSKQWLMNLFGLKGDVFKGIDQITQLQTHTGFELESRLILGMTEIFLLEDFQTGKARIDSLSNPSILSKYVQALTDLKTHNALKARNALIEIFEHAPVLEYFLAETYFQEQDFDKAKRHYRQFLKRNEGTAYIKDAHLKLSISSFYTNDPENYRTELKNTETKGKDRTEIDKNALKLYKSIDEQDSVGLMIRFAIDGGFYDRAQILIASQEKRQLPPYHALELTYRKARLAHLTEEIESAISLYREVIQQAGKISETYYAPNSFLQMAYLMREQGRKEEARMYFENVLEFRNHPYKKSLDNKAKLGMASLNHSND